MSTSDNHEDCYECHDPSCHDYCVDAWDHSDDWCIHINNVEDLIDNGDWDDLVIERARGLGFVEFNSFAVSEDDARHRREHPNGPIGREFCGQCN